MARLSKIRDYSFIIAILFCSDAILKSQALSLGNLPFLKHFNVSEKSEILRSIRGGERWGSWPFLGVGNNDDSDMTRPSYRGLLPFAESGKCVRGWSYRIRKGDDLLRYGPELECIFDAGISPSKVPVGPLYGTVLSVLNMNNFNHLINFVWWGKMVREINCAKTFEGKTYSRSVFIGWNNLLNNFMTPFVASLGTLDDIGLSLTPGEFRDHKSNMLLDYSVDFSQLCDNIEDLWTDQRMPFSQAQNMYPINQIFDALRLVGRRADGGSILLGKTFLRDSFGMSSTVVYFYFINYDLDLNPEFAPGQGLPPLRRNFSYSIPGVGKMTI